MNFLIRTKKTPLFLVLAISLLISCQKEKQAMHLNKYIIETEVKLKPGMANEVLALFKSTNPALVKEETDWISASFSIVEDMDVVLVRAEWRSKEAYA